MNRKLIVSYVLRVRAMHNAFCLMIYPSSRFFNRECSAGGLKMTLCKGRNNTGLAPDSRFG